MEVLHTPSVWACTPDEPAYRAWSRRSWPQTPETRRAELDCSENTTGWRGNYDKSADEEWTAKTDIMFENDLYIGKKMWFTLKQNFLTTHKNSKVHLKPSLSLSLSHLGWTDTPHNLDDLTHWCVNCVIESRRYCVLSQWNTNIDCSQQGVMINKMGALFCMFSCLKTTSYSMINTLDRLLLACGAAPLRQTRGRVPLLLCTKGTTTTAARGNEDQ